MRSTLRGLAAIVLAAALGLSAGVLVACGGGGSSSGDDGGGGDGVETAASGGESTEAPTAPAGATPGSRSVTIGKAFWHTGWKVTLKTATLESNVRRGEVTIDATFENLGDQEARFNSQLVLVVGSENYSTTALSQDLPRVPGGLSSDGVIAFITDPGIDLENAVLLVGKSTNEQASVPFGSSGELISLEPQELTFSGMVTVGALTMTADGGEVRADLPDVHSSATKGMKVLTLRFSVAVGSGIQLGQGALTSENILLKLPDGTVARVRSDGRSGVSELLQGKEGTTIDDLSVRFDIDDPVAGEGQYALQLKGKFGPGGAEVEGELPFTIE